HPEPGHAGVGAVCALAAVVEALVGDGEALDTARAVLLVDGKLDAVRDRLAADRTHRKVGADLDGAFVGTTATSTASAGKGDECRRGEDYQSPSSNHMVPPCAAWDG